MRFRLLVLLLGAASLVASSGVSGEGEAMIREANRFLDSLSAMQKAVTLYSFDAEKRVEWHYFPDSGYQRAYGYARPGIGYKYMDDKQEKLAHNLLRAGLSDRGFSKVQGVIQLEEILRIIENDTSGNRDREKYYYTIFGKPSASGTWGWRLEGHHLSLNFTIRDGKLVSATPAFFGANPHEVRRGTEKGLRVLGAEEDKAKQLLQSLESGQRDLAVVQHVAYRDILSFVDKRARLVNEPPGLPAAELTDDQYQALRSLVNEYAANGSVTITKGRMDRFDGTPREKIHFAWAGGAGPGEGVYYRVQTPYFLIEYANTQNRANHSHTVWRDWNGDFGHDVLAAHYQDYDHGIGEPIHRAAK